MPIAASTCLQAIRRTNRIIRKGSLTAAVRANYNNREKDVYETTEYLELFLRNLLLGEDNILSNREMHVAYKEPKESLEQMSTRDAQIVEILRAQPTITLQEVADKIGKSLRTVKMTVKTLQEKGIIERVGGKKNGSWKIKDWKIA